MTFQVFDLVRYEQQPGVIAIPGAETLNFAMSTGAGMDAPMIVPAGSTKRIEDNSISSFGVTSFCFRRFAYEA